MIAFEFRIDPEAKNAAVLDNDRAAAIALEAMVFAMNRAVTVIKPEVLALTPSGANRTLRSNFSTQVLTQAPFVIGTVHNAIAYAPYVEFGTGPRGKLPPLEPLIQWARFKFGLDEKQARSAGFALQRSIAARGTPAQHFMELGLDQSLSQLEHIFDQMQQSIINSLSQN